MNTVKGTHRLGVVTQTIRITTANYRLKTIHPNVGSGKTIELAAKLQKAIHQELQPVADRVVVAPTSRYKSTIEEVFFDANTR
jgi:hypothetical protein